MIPTGWADLAPAFAWRKSQRHLLEMCSHVTARWWTARGMALPEGFDPPEDVSGTLTLDDRLVLVDAWLHAPEAVLPAETREETHTILRRHGIAVTTAGLR